MAKSLLIRALAVPALAAVAVATAAVPSQAGGDHDPKNVAHHGAAGEAPENTIEAIDLAIDQDADFVEVEVQRTSDGVLVAFQDSTLVRTTNVEDVFPDRAPFRVGDFTFAELRQLDAGSWFAPEFAGEKIPSLGQVIREVTYYNGLEIEIVSPARYPGIEADLLEELQSHRGYFWNAVGRRNLVVKSTDVNSANAFHTLARTVPVGVVYNFTPADSALVAVSEWADEVDFLGSRVNQTLVDRVHDLGLKITAHTANTEAQMQAFIDLDVDGIVTDFPAVLDDVL